MDHDIAAILDFDEDTNARRNGKSKKKRNKTTVRMVVIDLEHNVRGRDGSKKRGLRY